MKLIYLPALSRDSLRTDWGRTSLNPLDPRLRGTAAYHPYALTSYWYWRTQPFTWGPEDFIFGDSGGYSARTLGVEIDPRDAVRWQVRTCTVGVILDAPPWGRWSERRECLRQTVAATKAALPVYLAAREAGSPFRWWGIVHGRTTAELDEWWGAISRIYPFTDEGEGWAFKPHPLNTVEAMAHVLSFLGEKGIRRAHFFASTGHHAVEALCCLGPGHGLALASVDSFSWRHMANAGQLLIPGRYGRTARHGSAARRYMLDCACGSCELLRRDLQEHADLIGDDFSYWKYRYAFHNALVMRDEFDTLRRRYAPTPTPA